MEVRSLSSKVMRQIRRVPLAALLFAGTTLLSGTVLALPRAPAHPSFHPAPHPAVHAFHPAMRAFHPIVHSGTYHFAAGFHPLHAALVAHVGFAHFTPAQRWAWTHGHWYHRWYNGRWGWWWFAGGAWFWYAAPAYPYPVDVSAYYYEAPESPGPMWYYCDDPPGYYPYVPTCGDEWQPVPAQGYGEEGSEEGPPPGQYDNEQGPPPGYDQGPPPGYNQGPPSGDNQGPPPGYDQGPPPGYDQGPPPGEYQGPTNYQQGPNDQNSNHPSDNGNSGPG